MRIAIRHLSNPGSPCCSSRVACRYELPPATPEPQRGPRSSRQRFDNGRCQIWRNRPRYPQLDLPGKTRSRLPAQNRPRDQNPSEPVPRQYGIPAGAINCTRASTVFCTGATPRHSPHGARRGSSSDGYAFLAVSATYAIVALLAHLPLNELFGWPQTPISSPSGWRAGDSLALS